MSFAAKESERVFHNLFTFVLMVGAITYFAQASNPGWSAVKQADNLGIEIIQQSVLGQICSLAGGLPFACLGAGSDLGRLLDHDHLQHRPRAVLGT